VARGFTTPPPPRPKQIGPKAATKRDYPRATYLPFIKHTTPCKRIVTTLHHHHLLQARIIKYSTCFFFDSGKIYCSRDRDEGSLASLISKDVPIMLQARKRFLMNLITTLERLASRSIISQYASIFLNNNHQCSKKNKTPGLIYPIM
jgi:hypothetical protein